ncbi:hypothetical protein BGZ83_007597 [Gryganskiella cystojenkinii]|nr:hypothetical protein BGZ83_007597 [Gryganskiella cystojenkinii]
MSAYGVTPEVLSQPTQNAQNLENLIAHDLRHLASVVPSHGPELKQPRPRRYHINDKGFTVEPTRRTKIDAIPVPINTTSTTAIPVVRYSKSCTACLTQGFQCSGHKPICSQCYNSSSRYAGSLRQKQHQLQHQQQLNLVGGKNSKHNGKGTHSNAIGFSRLDGQDTLLSDQSGSIGTTAILTCSYPVEGTPLLPSYLFKNLTMKDNTKPRLNPLDHFGRNFDQKRLAKAVQELTMVPIKDKPEAKSHHRQRASADKDQDFENEDGHDHDSDVKQEEKNEDDLTRWEFHYDAVPTIDRNPASAVDYLLQGQMRLDKLHSKSDRWTYKRFLKSYRNNKQVETEEDNLDPILASDQESESENGEERDRESEEERGKKSKASRARVGNWIYDRILANEEDDDSSSNTALTSTAAKEKTNQPPQVTLMTKWMPTTGEDSAISFSDKNPTRGRLPYKQRLVRDRLVVGLSRENQETLLEESTSAAFRDETSLRKSTATGVRNNEVWSGIESKTRVEIDQEMIKSAPELFPTRASKERNRWKRDFKVRKKAGLASDKVPKYRKRMFKTFRPWVADKDDWVIPSACDIPETSFLQALHYYASYYYTHTHPCPDVFEAMDLTSHIALGMIIQETISDFAFKLGKEGQMEDLEVHQAKEAFESEERKRRRQPESENETDSHMILDHDGTGGADSEQDEEDESAAESTPTAMPQVRTRFGQNRSDDDDMDGDDEADEEEEFARINRRTHAVDEDFWPPQSLQEVRSWSEEVEKQIPPTAPGAANTATDKKQRKAVKKNKEVSKAAELLAKLRKNHAAWVKKKVAEERKKARQAREAQKAQEMKNMPQKQQHSQLTPSPLPSWANEPILIEEDEDEEEQEEERLVRKRPRPEQQNARETEEEEDEEEEEEEEKLTRKRHRREREDENVDSEEDDADMSALSTYDRSPTPAVKRQRVTNKRQDEGGLILGSVDSDVYSDLDDDAVASEQRDAPHESTTVPNSDHDEEEEDDQAQETEDDGRPAWTPVTSTRFGSLFDRSRGHDDDDDDEDEEEGGGSSSKALSQVVVDDTTTDEDEVVGPSEAEESDEY